MVKTVISPQDILLPPAFAPVRDAMKACVKEIKTHRRVSVGPYATFYFECYDTLVWQIQEMLRIEHGGAAEVQDEIDAYAPLLPQGSDWTATLMFEIPDADHRRALLSTLGHVEDTITLRVGDHCVPAVSTDQDVRTTSEGKTSAIHFLRFVFEPPIKALLLTKTPSVVLAIGHKNYNHHVTLETSVVRALLSDLTP